MRPRDSKIRKDFDYVENSKYPYVVYCFIFPNGKRYIGITHDLRKRINQHLEMLKTPTTAFHHALKKYGYNACEKVILAYFNSYDDLKKAEVQLIKSYKTKDGLGYNLTVGGDGVLGYKGTGPKKERKVISLNTGKVWNSIKEACAETGIGASCILAVCKGRKPHAKGLRFAYYDSTKSYQTVPVLAKVNNRDYECRNYKSTPVISVNLESGIFEYFKSIRQASLYTKVSEASIWRSFKGISNKSNYKFIRNN